MNPKDGPLKEHLAEQRSVTRELTMIIIIIIVWHKKKNKGNGEGGGGGDKTADTFSLLMT